MLLFLLGLITGLIIMSLKNPRMGLSAHLEGLLNGIFLVVAGFVWNELKIPALLKKILFGTLIAGAFFNWFITLLAAILGTSELTPLAGAGYFGTAFRENLIKAGLVVVVISMLFSLTVMVYGLRGKKI